MIAFAQRPQLPIDRDRVLLNRAPLAGAAARRSTRASVSPRRARLMTRSPTLRISSSRRARSTRTTCDGATRRRAASAAVGRRPACGIADPAPAASAVVGVSALDPSCRRRATRATVASSIAPANTKSNAIAPSPVTRGAARQISPDRRTAAAAPCPRACRAPTSSRVGVNVICQRGARGRRAARRRRGVAATPTPRPTRQCARSARRCASIDGSGSCAAPRGDHLLERLRAVEERVEAVARERRVAVRAARAGSPSRRCASSSAARSSTIPEMPFSEWKCRNSSSRTRAVDRRRGRSTSRARAAAAARRAGARRTRRSSRP